jgi:hypothetical protein
MDDTNNDTTDVDTTVDTDTTTDTTTDADAGNAFLNGLDVKYQNDTNLQKFTSAEQVLDSYTELSKKLGKDKAVIPQEGDDFNAQIEEYMSKVGMPETAEGYELKDIDLSELGVEGTIPTAELAKVARELHMTKTQVDGILNFYKDDVIANHNTSSEAVKEARDAAKVELRKEYGAKFDENIQKADAVFKEHFPSLANSGLGNDAGLIKDLVKLSANFSEASLGKTNNSGTKTPAEAKADKFALMATPAYTDQLHPEHAATVEKYRALLAMENSGK